MTNHVSIQSMIKSDDKGYLPCHLFAYSSKSLPGIEIIGMGKRGKILKEKIVYWLKHTKTSLTSRRYVLCLETFDRLNFDDEESVLWLELPTVVLLLVLSESIDLKNVDQCFCVGQLGLNGTVHYPSTDLKNLEIAKILKQNMGPQVIIGQSSMMKTLPESSGMQIIDFNELIHNKKKPKNYLGPNYKIKNC